MQFSFTLASNYMNGNMIAQKCHCFNLFHAEGVCGVHQGLPVYWGRMGEGVWSGCCGSVVGGLLECGRGAEGM